MRNRPDFPALVREARIRATRLLKQLEQPEPAADAARRLAGLPYWRAGGPEAVLAHRNGIRRKHALDAVAMEMGFEHWLHLKMAAGAQAVFDTERLFAPPASAFWNVWVKKYDEARSVLAGGPERRFLFPFRQHYVLCEEGFLTARGVDTTDPDWERIGRDWARASDKAAWLRLAARLDTCIR
ncbi:MAG: hypothetical protein R2762_20060 [Bryobacteraceae bacterium]